ncbi:4-alpha-glucanotransferase [Bacteriovorax sp. Seq25_V]|uniref:4-alpha-glucanotransferase n=1 Tax=Bacteriovorax sp. Seq25_V TaxID=1201288 RepID=UPI00038A3468|nr:4-alpha-glucanotransferase [Bacteriovorax sp. Seq25_V]EQC43846.1 4-alpha-glucanotransferase [Bacteriovorax sp. Seq25_V]
MELKSNLLRKAALALNIQTGYIDVNGDYIRAAMKSLHRIIEDLCGLKISKDQDLIDLFENLKKKKYQDKVDSHIVLWENEESKLLIYTESPLTNELSGILKLEDGTSKNITLSIKDKYKTELGTKSVAIIPKNIAPIGYHRLQLNLEGENQAVNIIFAPKHIEIKDQKQWGPFVPIYALKSESDIGIGSFKELRDLAPLLKENGASWISLLPILAANFDTPDCDPSPYSSLTRLFWNELYLDLDRLVAKYESKEAKSLMDSDVFKAEKEKLRANKFVQYYECYQLKKKVLSILSEEFFSSKKDQSPEYQQFKSENPKIDEYARFRSSDVKEQNFHRFCQFEMCNELKEFKKDTGLGLYMDYPVGVNDSGFDFQNNGDVFFKAVSVGAPPEPIFSLGQDWGFPSFHPFGIRKDNYTYFKKSLQSHLRYSNILRLDHIMGLYRIYCVPKGYTGKEGVYLKFPKDELMAITVLESSRMGVSLIGENLGTVPKQVDKLMKERNVKGMWVWQFEAHQDQAPALKSIQQNQLLCFDTHDMPMLESYLDGSDLSLVSSLGILSESNAHRIKDERINFLKRWEVDSKEFQFELTKKLANSQAEQMVINLENIWGEREPQNIPGTWKEYPNWRRKFALDLNEITHSEKVKKTLAILKEARNSSTTGN